MKTYHVITSFLLMLVAIFYLKTEMVMSGVGSMIGKKVSLASVHTNYVAGVMVVIILAYLIRKQES